MNRKDFEIMAPVGSRESLAAAIQAGADSIYFGIEPNSYIVTGAIITLAGIFLALWPKNIFSMGMNSDF